MGRRPLPRKIARVRLDPAVYDELEAANPKGAAAELTRILEEHRRGALGDAIGQLAGMVAERAEFTVMLYTRAKNDETWRSEFLGLVRDTISSVLTGLGAAQSVPYEENGVSAASAIAFDFIAQIKNQKPADSGALARISAALGFSKSPEIKSVKGRNK